MEQQFLELCQQHGLTGVMTMFQPKFNSLTVYLHFGEVGCVSGSGEGFSKALSLALEALRLERSTPVSMKGAA